MNEFEHNKMIYSQAKRGTYIIFPLKYHGHLDIKNLQINQFEEEKFYSNDWSDLLQNKCDSDNGFVKGFTLKRRIENIKFEDGTSIPITKTQLFVFNNQVAFLSVLLSYDNSQIEYIYKFINPGYIDDEKNKYIDTLRKEIIAVIKQISVDGKNAFFEVIASSDKMAIKETYIFNVALVSKRFSKLDTLNKLTSNAHKIIDLSRDFEDSSEKDISYVYGAKDVELCTYRWGACISSQSISYVYAFEGEEAEEHLIEISRDDLLLTILVLHQKSTCMLLNQEIQNTFNERTKKNFFKEVLQLKQKALEFRAIGTLAPSQVSRWNNICETYRNLIEVNGINEALEEIEQKIELIRDEQERKSSQIQNSIATVIAIFGLISIVAAVLQIVDLVQGGSLNIIYSLIISCVGVSLFILAWIIMIYKKR